MTVLWLRDTIGMMSYAAYYQASEALFVIEFLDPAVVGGTPETEVTSYWEMFTHGVYVPFQDGAFAAVRKVAIRGDYIDATRDQLGYMMDKMIAVFSRDAAELAALNGPDAPSGRLALQFRTAAGILDRSKDAIIDELIGSFERNAA